MKRYAILLVLLLFLASCTEKAIPNNAGAQAGLINNFDYLSNATTGTLVKGLTQNIYNMTTAVYSVKSASEVTVFMNCTNLTGNGTLNPVIAFTPVRIQYSPDNNMWFNSTAVLSCFNNNSWATPTEKGINYIRVSVLSNVSNSTSNNSLALIVAAK